MLNRRLFTSLVLMLLLCAGAFAVQAQSSAGDVFRLSLSDCLEMALTNNLDLVSARKDPQIAEKQIDVNRAPFDGAVGSGLNFSQSGTDETITDKVGGGTTTGSSDTDVLSGNVYFSHLLNFGGSYDLTLNLLDVDASSRSIEATTGFFQDATYAQADEGLKLRYEMPLLSGFGKEVNMVNVLLARSGLEISREDLRLQAMLTIQQTEDAYWDLLAANAALTVAQESLKLAEDLYELNKKKVEVGTLAPIDVTQAEAGVAQREEGVIVAETTVRNAEDTLRQLLAIPHGDPLWLSEIELTDRPEFEEQTVDVDQAQATALERRPEIVTARQRLRDSELSERVARRGTRHSLSFNAEIGTDQSDVDRRVEIVSPPGFDPTDTNTDGDGDDWAVGLTYSYPLRNRRAKANYAIARLNTEKSDVALLNSEQEIRVDVRVAARNVESGVKRVAAARANTVLQRKTLDAEQKKYDNGMSTSFQVLQIQNDLSDAQLAEIRAILDYTKSLADLERAKGTLLEARGLSLGP